MPGTPKMHERMRAFIDARGVSRKILAINMKVSESRLSLLLNGKRRMTVDDYEALCTAMAVDPCTFYRATQAEGRIEA